jgi:Kef-type K+ transport system membrane component KefB
VILGVTGIIFFAIVGRHLAQRFGQPSVLGELLIGVALGAAGYFFGVDLLIVLREGPVIFDLLTVALNSQSAAAAEAEFGARAPEALQILRDPGGGVLLRVAHAVDVFSRYGVILLLFVVGLDNSVDQMKVVGSASLRVALIGVLLPFLLGLLAVTVVAPELAVSTAVFIAGTFVATSVGVTAGVLEELKADRTIEGRTILGAAVFDDVFGLLVLAIASGIVVSGEFSFVDTARIVLLAAGYLVSALFIGPYVVRFIVYCLRGFDLVEAKIFSAFLFVMILAWTASLAGLASIVGAFAAGLIMDDGFFDRFRGTGRALTLKELVRPFEVVLAPIFFVTMGIQVKLESFLSADVFVLAMALTVTACVGKVASGWGAQRGSNRWMVGFGMMPRGEVGLIFAAIGRGLGVLGDSVFAAIVLAVTLTTILAPPLMRRLGARSVDVHP